MRREITNNEIDGVLDSIQEYLYLQVDKKGRGCFRSIHECCGVIDEEVNEMKQAIQENNHEKIKGELADIIVASIWAYVSIHNEMVDW